MEISGRNRRFLFLQGPNGPFFRNLERMLSYSGAEVWRVGFNQGDRVFWPAKSFICFCQDHEKWPAAIKTLFNIKAITDIVLYDDARPIHAQAIEAARSAGITVHVFEEGYLRPDWVTYERNGVHRNSRLVYITLPQMQAALASVRMDLPDVPAHGSNKCQCIFWCAVYSGFAWAGLWTSHCFRSDRKQTALLKYLFCCSKRLARKAIHRWERMRATLRIMRGGFSYHLAMLPLQGELYSEKHLPFSTLTEFLTILIEGFAIGAVFHYHLVIKAHPLEEDIAAVARDVQRLATFHGVDGRVHFVPGGKLAQLLNDASSAVAVNFPAAEQAICLGLPLKIFGTATFAKPELVSTQSLSDFFALPSMPDARAYRDYRRYLMETSQVPGGFYSLRRRRELVRQVVDMMLHTDDPYDALTAGKAVPRTQLGL